MQISGPNSNTLLTQLATMVWVYLTILGLLCYGLYIPYSDLTYSEIYNQSGLCHSQNVRLYPPKRYRLSVVNVQDIILGWAMSNIDWDHGDTSWLATTFRQNGGLKCIFSKSRFYGLIPQKQNNTYLTK